MKWFKIKDNETLELFIVNSDEQPENSVLVTDENSNFIKPKANNIIFTQVVEGITPEEIAEANEKKYKELDIEYSRKISDLVEKHVQKNIIDGTPIPQEVLDKRERLKAEFRNLTNKDIKKLQKKKYL